MEGFPPKDKEKYPKGLIQLISYDKTVLKLMELLLAKINLSHLFQWWLVKTIFL